MSAIHEALFKYFGYNKFRPGQEEIINEILSGNNVLAVLPTGAGKSICYQIPSIVSDSFSIVISPLIALMKDQVDSLNAKETIATFINSSLDYNETELILNETEQGKYKLLYVAPERLENVSFAERIKRMNPSYLFVDEAHCISEWGHNFRPSYRKIKEFIDFVELKKISAFTATATPEVEKDIVYQLGFESPKIFVRGFNRENLLINVIHTKKKKEKTLQLMTKYSSPAIIYTASRKKAEEISEYLNLHKIKCSYYHAGLSSVERKFVQESFLNDKIPVIAATNAFGMGIDKKDIRLIIHFNAPGSIEAYYQEIGRAGRDGKISDTFLLFDDTDIDLQEFLILNSNPDQKTIYDVYNAIMDFSKVAIGMKPENEIEINSEFISLYARRQIQKGILKASLRILENAGYLREVSNYEKKHTIQFLYSLVELKEFVKNVSSTNQKDVVLYLLRKYGSKILNNKRQIDLPQISSEINLPEYLVEDSLKNLAEIGIVSYYKPPVKDTVIITSPRVDSKHLKLDLRSINENLFHQHKKLDSVRQYAYSSDCRFKFILNYFGDHEDNTKCGRCDNCNKQKNVFPEQKTYLSELILKTVYEFNLGITHTYVLNVLKGKSKDPALQKISTYGSCQNYKALEISDVFFELVDNNSIIKINSLKDKYAIGDKGIELLKSKDIIKEEVKQDASYELNLILYHKLREVRAAAAKRFVQTERMICSDDILRAVVFSKPTNKHKLLDIDGFNDRMYNKLGEDFLEVINNFLKSAKEHPKEIASNGDYSLNVNTINPNALPKNIYDTYLLLKKGYKVKEISDIRKLSEPVISMQIETIISYIPETDISALIDKDMIEVINEEIDKKFFDLKDLKSRLPFDIGYPLLRIALAKKKAAK
jgi:ATP-dependent DNA helicase RecQ